MFEDYKVKFILYAGILLAMFGAAGNYLEIEPVHNLFYLFAWWAYIFIADAVIYHIKSDSLIVSRTEEFLVLAVWSAFIWFIFELANLRLQNWHYMYVPSDRTLRWTGYLLAYATVLPGIFETMELLETFGLFKGVKTRRLAVTPALLKKTQLAGWVLLALPFIRPRYFFGAIWIAFIFLLEPLNYRLGLKSLLKDLEKGEPRRLALLPAAGLICGFLWEFWNFQAGAKWVYTVPLAGNWKLFEMPAAGYIGFPLFAVECYVMYNFITWLRRGKTWEEAAQEPLPEIRPKPWFLIASALILLFTCYIAVRAIDSHTVRLYLACL
ncbi:MAG: hypothetical protein HY796_03070 [Elusimicrobia bacterium]|nr:hypothetical protein [Elusimicrobiota bacterium]